MTSGMKLSKAQAGDIMARFIELLKEQTRQIAVCSDDEAKYMLIALVEKLAECKRALTAAPEEEVAEAWRNRSWRGIRPQTRKRYRDMVEQD